jgi:hypothetical protein
LLFPVSEIQIFCFSLCCRAFTIHFPPSRWETKFHLVNFLIIMKCNLWYMRMLRTKICISVIKLQNINLLERQCAIQDEIKRIDYENAFIVHKLYLFIYRCFLNCVWIITCLWMTNFWKRKGDLWCLYDPQILILPLLLSCSPPLCPYRLWRSPSLPCSRYHG